MPVLIMHAIRATSELCTGTLRPRIVSLGTSNGTLRPRRVSHGVAQGGSSLAGLVLLLVLHIQQHYVGFWCAVRTRSSRMTYGLVAPERWISRLKYALAHIEWSRQKGNGSILVYSPINMRKRIFESFVALSPWPWHAIGAAGRRAGNDGQTVTSQFMSRLPTAPVKHRL